MLVKKYSTKINVDIKKPINIGEILKREEKKMRKKFNLKHNILKPTDIEILFVDPVELTINFYYLEEEKMDDTVGWGL